MFSIRALADRQRVYIEGRLQTRSWEDQQTGQKRYMTEVIANDLIMLDARREHLTDTPGEDGRATDWQERSPEPMRGASPEPAGQGQPSRFMHATPAEAVPAGVRHHPVAPIPDEDDLPF